MNNHVNDGEEARRCPTCESLRHRECEPENETHEDAGPDFEASDFGSIICFKPLTDAAKTWIDEHVHEPRWWGLSLVVEYRYAGQLANGILLDGLEIQDA